jgi:four helix bundle protein
MDKIELQERLTQFALRIINLVDHMPRRISADAISRQIIRSGTSPSANYRAACIAKSEKDFMNKMKMVEEELDETAHWLMLIMESQMLPEQRVRPLYEENLELLKINISALKTMREKINAKK